MSNFYFEKLFNSSYIIFFREISISFFSINYLNIMKSYGKKKTKSRHTARLKNQTQQQSSDNNRLDLILYEKFKAFMTSQRLSALRSRLNEFYGKNFTINYKPTYGFQEEWHNKQFNVYEKSQFQVINQSYFGVVLSITIMLINTAFIWFRNLQSFFSDQNDISWNSFSLYVTALGVQFLDSGIKIWFFCEHKSEKQKKQRFILDYLKILYPNLLCFHYLIVILLKVQHNKNQIWIFYQFLCQYLLFSRSRQIFQSFQYMTFALRSQYQYKIFDLITNLIIFTHFVSLMLFWITSINPEVNWFKSLHLVQSTPFIRYVYSFYFCSTTILTVGYGDITPKNQYQVIMVILVQIFGIIFYGYMINQIGYNLSALRQRKQIVKKQLGLIEKMSKYYKMNQDLVHRARSYLINHHLESAPLSPEQQKGLMLKFNQQLRSQIQSQNTLSIVKSSIFFLCRWSKSMQNSVANHLVHYLFSPGEQIYQPQGKQRIYLIRLGKIDIYTQRRGNRLGNKSILKSISIDLQKQVSNNCYGYTSVISTRPVRLYAISKDYTSAFYIEKLRFMECVHSKSNDFEYYHEIKSKIDQNHLWESLEVPLISNSKHHYSPTHLWIIRNSKKVSVQKHQRRSYLRQSRNLFRGSNIFHDPEELNNIHRVFIPSLQDLNTETNRKLYRQSESLKRVQSKFNTIEQLCGEFQMREFKRFFHHYFQQGKQYHNYFIDKNPAKIITKIQRQYVGNKRYLKQSICEKWRSNSTHPKTLA